MRKYLLLMLTFATWLGAAQLNVTQGSVTAHTEVFGDSNIEPSTTAITSHLSMGDTPESIEGSVIVSMTSLASDNSDRDEHMHEAMESSTYPNATYTFTSVTPEEKGYKIEGTMKLHGVTKPVTFQTEITDNGDTLSMKGTGSILMTDFGIEPPVLLFLTVRDQVDLRFDVIFSQQ